MHPLVCRLRRYGARLVLPTCDDLCEFRLRRQRAIQKAAQCAVLQSLATSDFSDVEIFYSR
jgi:hypothetical protein